jgi:type III pantothenate kinase
VILAIDVGNTETTIALFRGDDIVEHWRLTTESARTSDEMGLLLRSLLLNASLPAVTLSGAAIGSVVPLVTAPLADACRQWLGVDPIIVDGSSRLPITLDVMEPLSVGADRIINTLAASRIFGRDTIVVDLGTATTFDCITRDGVFLGGVIGPGVRISAETLFRRTSKLPAPDLAAPDHVIGKRTEDCIRAGVLYGAAESIDGIVRRIKKEWPTGDVPFVVATGGLATTIAPHCTEVERVEPLLTLIGLRIAFGLLRADHHQAGGNAQ